MRLTIFGASGRTGRQVVAQALAAGHDVTAVVRDPGRLPVPAQDGLRAAVATFDDSAAVLAAVTGADAVVDALGTPARTPTTLRVDAARVIIAAMREAGVRRLVVVSASGAHTTGDELHVRLPGEAATRLRAAAPVRGHAGDGGDRAGERPRLDDRAPPDADRQAPHGTGAPPGGRERARLVLHHPRRSRRRRAGGRDRRRAAARRLSGPPGKARETAAVRCAATRSAAARPVPMQAGTPTPCRADPATASPAGRPCSIVAHPVEVADPVLRAGRRPSAGRARRPVPP